MGVLVAQKSPIRVSLRRFHFRVGLHIVLFEDCSAVRPVDGGPFWFFWNIWANRTLSPVTKSRSGLTAGYPTVQPYLHFRDHSARQLIRGRILNGTCNQPFSEWNRIFPEPAMTVAAIDRLVHHATILELNTESYRRRSALARGTKVTGDQLPAKASAPPA